jgi:hypothetical protein
MGNIDTAAGSSSDGAVLKTDYPAGDYGCGRISDGHHIDGAGRAWAHLKKQGARPFIISSKKGRGPFVLMLDFGAVLLMEHRIQFFYDASQLKDAL